MIWMSQQHQSLYSYENKFNCTNFLTFLWETNFSNAAWLFRLFARKSGVIQTSLQLSLLGELWLGYMWAMIICRNFFQCQSGRPLVYFLTYFNCFASFHKCLRQRMDGWCLVNSPAQQTGQHLTHRHRESNHHWWQFDSGIMCNVLYETYIKWVS